MYRLTIRGIFFALSSIIAICRGSCWPSRSTKTGAFIEICSALVPRILALSYLVIYGVVVRWSFGIFLSLGALSFPLICWAAAASPDSTISVESKASFPFVAASSPFSASAFSSWYSTGSSGSYSGSSSS